MAVTDPATTNASRARPATIDTLVGERIIRFDRTERLLHWATAVLVLSLMTTGAILYFGPLETLVGRRLLVKDVHVYSGLMLPFPLLAALAGRWRDGLKRDVARISRWTDDDRRWLRSRGRSARVRLGKFNAGQKLNALLVAGVLPVALLTGSVMKWFSPFPDSWRTGATFVHDLGAFAIWFAITGHILKAISEPVALRSMWRGWVPERWAERHRPRWHAEVVGPASADLAPASGEPDP